MGGLVGLLVAWESPGYARPLTTPVKSEEECPNPSLNLQNQNYLAIVALAALAEMDPKDACSLWMHWMCQHWNQDQTTLLNCLVTISKDWLEESWTWHCCWLCMFCEMWLALKQLENDEQ
ncbi:hypothetical protein Y1Q_0004759 [Alligator mississippiensis]|uniref:Uncharacterized protein n=1 Tax=Alligator mississippiensis TaxID=8496 RepID=A0A151NMD4_ALLMI|nr:hypothetical protein Y1Q_0004759 [Alligator mississippiensis]